MAESRLQAKLVQTKLELQQLKEHMEIGAVTVHKDLSLVSLIPKWSGSDSMVFLEEFFSTTGSSAKIENWKQTDHLQIAILKLCGSVKKFCQGCSELHTKETNWQTFKEAFRLTFITRAPGLMRPFKVGMKRMHLTRCAAAI